MAKYKKKFPFSLDVGLLVLLAICLFSSILTFRRFAAYQSVVDDTMKSNLEILRDEHKRSLEELRLLVNSGILRSSSSVVSLPSSNSLVRSSAPSVPSLYRSLPSGLSIIRVGDWYLSDGVWKYGLGDMSPVGLITNITRGLVYTDIDTFSFCNRVASVPFDSASRSKSDKGVFHD